MEYIKSKDIFLLMRDIMKMINPTLMEHASGRGPIRGV